MRLKRSTRPHLLPLWVLAMSTMVLGLLGLMLSFGAITTSMEVAVAPVIIKADQRVTRVQAIEEALRLMAEREGGCERMLRHPRYELPDEVVAQVCFP